MPSGVLVIGPALYSFRALWRHYRQCRRTKRTTANALAFEVNAEANLLALQQELRTHTYRPGRSICFITDGPKPREVFAANFRDRAVHHLLVAHQERVFEPIFIHDSYACRKGKGALAASDRLMTFLRQVTANGRRPAWALKLDVASFFPSIHKATLYWAVYRVLRSSTHHGRAGIRAPCHAATAGRLCVYCGVSNAGVRPVQGAGAQRGPPGGGGAAGVRSPWAGLCTT